MGNTKTCIKCNKEFNKKPSDSKKYWEKKRFCSIKCSGTTFSRGVIPWNKGKDMPRGDKSPSFKGGINVSTSGYVRVLIAGTGSYAFEHRLIMEKYLGRKLKKNEIVHHKNGIRSDNRIENLQVMEKRVHDGMETKRRWEEGIFYGR